MFSGETCFRQGTLLGKASQKKLVATNFCCGTAGKQDATKHFRVPDVPSFDTCMFHRCGEKAILQKDTSRLQGRYQMLL